MTKPYAIYGARLIDPTTGYDGPGGVLMQEGRIVALSHKPTFDSLPEGAALFDAQGCALGPGFVDMAPRVNTLFGPSGETVRSLDQAALSAGVTSVAISPAMDQALDSPERVMALNAEAQHAASHVRAVGALTQGLGGTHLAEVGLMSEQGIAAVSDGGVPIADSRFLYNALMYATGYQLPVILSALDPHFAHAVATDNELAARFGLSTVPEGVEAVAAHRLLGLAGLAGARAILSGVSVPHTLIPIADARDRGQSIYAAAQVHHLTLNDVDTGALDSRMRFTPPLRAELDRRMLVEGLKEGIVDIITSGHAPCSSAAKTRPYAEATPGIAAIEDWLPAALGLYHSGDIPLESLWRAMSLTPARALGLEAASLRPGALADLVLVDLDAPFVQRAEALRSNARQSAYDGRRLQGRVLKTWRAGRLVYDLEQEQVAL